MAQVVKHSDSDDGRLRAFLRHHPVWMVVFCVFAFAVVACIVFGMSAARGNETLIERAASTGQTEMHEGADTGAASEEPAAQVVVDVAGAVASPGIVHLPEDARVDDAIEAAGGLLEDADTSSLNRAAKITDGTKVYVPAVGEASPAGDASTGADAPGSVTGSGLISINSATAEELQTLSGVGPSTAQAIIKDREQNGPFSSLEDLMRVSGIGEKKFSKLKDAICL